MYKKMKIGLLLALVSVITIALIRPLTARADTIQDIDDIAAARSCLQS